MIGGDPVIVDEQVAPLPTDRLASRIEVAWPLASAPIAEASKANVTAQLLMPGTDNTSVPCRYDPDKVELWAWRHYYDNSGPAPAAQSVLVPSPVASPTAASPAASPSPTPPPVRGDLRTEKDPVLLATGVKRYATVNNITYPVWDFNDVDVSYARNATGDRWLELFVAVDDDTIKMDPAPWFYGGDKNKDWQDPRPLPTASCQ
jgi:hypothetical protein